MVRRVCRLEWILSISAAVLLVFSSQSYSGESNSLEGPLGYIKKFTGKVSLKRGTKVFPVTSGFKIKEGDQVKTGPGSSVEIFSNKKLLMIGENAELALNTEAPNSSAVPTDASGETLSVKLSKGKLRALVGGAKTDVYKMKIYTRTAVAGVRGTQLDVVSDGEGENAKTAVITTQGKESLDFYTNQPGASGEEGAGNYKKVTVSEGTYVGALANGQMLPPKALDEEQWQNLRTRDLENRAMEMRLSATGEMNSLGSSQVVGISPSELEAKPPTSVDMGAGKEMPLPPPGFAFNAEAGRYQPVETKVTVVVSPNGDASPVITIPPSPLEVARANLLTDTKFTAIVEENSKLNSELSTLLKSAASGDAASAKSPSVLDAQIVELKQKLAENSGKMIEAESKQLEVEETLLSADLKKAADPDQKKQTELRLTLLRSEGETLDVKKQAVEMVTKNNGTNGNNRDSFAGASLEDITGKLQETQAKVEQLRRTELGQLIEQTNKNTQGPALADSPSKGESMAFVKTATGVGTYASATTLKELPSVLLAQTLTTEKLSKTVADYKNETSGNRAIASGSPGLSSPSPDIASYCSANPGSPACSGPQISTLTNQNTTLLDQGLAQLAASNCGANPTLPGCGQVLSQYPALVQQTTGGTSQVTQGQCVLNPSAPECQGGMNDPCLINPSLSQCGSNVSSTTYFARPVILQLTR